jgi:protein-S-isoprenylcysteine O-methyltransferase Ste14
MPTTALLIGVVLCIGFHMIFPIRIFIPPIWNLIGLIPLLFGIWINLDADRVLKNAETTVKPFQESNTLVQAGAYRISRNPMYLGFVSILIGISVLLRSLSPYFVVVIFAIVINQAYIKVEERMLAEKFGDDWIMYQSRVRKWI